jgi:hypothetical protein
MIAYKWFRLGETGTKSLGRTSLEARPATIQG